MRKNSLCIIEHDLYDGIPREGGREGGRDYPGERILSNFAVSFSYDSLVPAVVRIFIDAIDKSTPLQIR